MKRFLVISPNGYGNIGDDICAYAGAKMIRDISADFETRVTAPPVKTTLLDWADVIVLSGGGVLYDRDFPNVMNFMRCIEYAHKKNKRSCVLGVGVQGIVTDEGKKVYNRILRYCDFVSVRTPRDKAELDTIGFTESIVTFDIAFYTPNIVKNRHFKLPFNLRPSGNKDGLAIGMSLVNLEKMKKKAYKEKFYKFDDTIKRFLKNTPHKVTFFQNAAEDKVHQRKLASDYGAYFVKYKNIKDLNRVYAEYAKQDIFIGVRLHSIALAMMNDIPVIPVGSGNAKQNKLSAFNLPTLKDSFININDFSKLESKLDEINGGEINVTQLSNVEKDHIQKQLMLNRDLLVEHYGQT